MPYAHAGEIGDVWKHWPLLAVLSREPPPRRYLETNSARAVHALDLAAPRVRYGAVRFLEMQARFPGRGDAYLEALERERTGETGRHLGSPGLAMALLRDTGTAFRFHDLEPDALEDVARFAREELRLSKDRVETVVGDALACFAADASIGPGDFVFLDPYTPFDANASGVSFLDVFDTCVARGAAALMWYGYDDLDTQGRTRARLREIAERSDVHVLCAEAWQVSMRRNGQCDVNPGVPGCGVAAANVGDGSRGAIAECLEVLGEMYRDATYEGEPAGLATALNGFGSPP
ncbi:S-adenosyl-L-methionine-dependent methyltransferase [Hyaloraphidium curvatum]|nr:S-adenosyl-L-methionine-dependent methyltransferase [Hyaloraphidium curvatum]